MMIITPYRFAAATQQYTTAWKRAQTAASVARTSAPPWGDPTFGPLANASDSDESSVAVCFLYNGIGATPAFSSETLRMTNLEATGVPSGATIDGLRVRLKRKTYDANTAATYSVKFRKNDGTLSNELVSGAGNWDTTLTWETWGAANSLAGLSLTQSELTNTGFGVDIVVDGASDGSIGCISMVQFEITYTA